MEKRVLLAVVLSFIVLYGYQAMFPPPTRQEAPATATGPAPSPGTPSAPSAATPSAATPSAATPSAAAAGQAAPPLETAAVPTLVADTEERDVVVENEHVRAVFTNRGAALKSWRLKRYFEKGTKEPLELVPVALPEGSKRPFMLLVDDPAITARIQQALYKPSAAGLNVSAAASTLSFDYQESGGVTVRKEFTFSPESPYVVGFTASVTSGNPLVPTVLWGPALGDGLSASSSMGIYSPPPQPIFYRDGDVTRVGQGDIPEYAVQEGVFGFAGVDDHYFIAAALPQGQPVQLRYQPLQLPSTEPEGQAANFVDWSARYQGPPTNAKFFIGPKDFEVLAAVDRDFVRAIHFGIFSWLVVPLLRALNWVNGYIGNYGWSIIALTALINIAMFPLRHKSVVSMRKMQEIQPEVKAIQERYAKLKVTDPARQKMNTEMMNLYRERGVNPASGCVPMLLTLPVLFAFYSMLSVAVELRGAPFIGWITDLSAHDPLFITPVLMAGTQFLQTKMTPSTADPMQQKMMLFMPIIFMAFFLWAPSGLVLYWTVSNAWAIGQQALTNKIIGPMQVRTVRPPAERKLKNAGAGKSEQASKEKK